MPVRQLAPSRNLEHHQYVDALLKEWVDVSSTNNEPIIFEERDRQHRLSSIYVIWSRWANIDRIERSEIIMEAAERKLPEDEALNILIAMGLTPDEARAMGMEF